MHTPKPPQIREPQIEPQVEEIINMHTFQQLLQKVEKLLESKEVWCYDKYHLEKFGDPPISILWDPVKDRFWPAFTTPRDHTGCPGYRPVVTSRQLVVWLVSVIVGLLERLDEG